jgi:ubiquinone/menaquinone biosynthesis C-methylase UbiE
MTDKPWYTTAFDKEYYDAFLPTLTPELTRRQVDFLIEHGKFPPKAHILDLCCGQGRHAIELAQRGYQVTGLDLSPYLLDIAKRQSAAASVDITLIHADMRQIPTPAKPYDAVINMFSAYGYLESDEEDQKSLRAVAGVLAPGGIFVLDAMNREAAIRYWQPWRWAEQENGSLFAEELHLDIRTGRQHVREVLVHANGQRTEDSHSYRLYTYTEIARQLREEGFAEETFDVYGDFDSSSYRIGSPRMIVLARRPGRGAS